MFQRIISCFRTRIGPVKQCLVKQIKITKTAQCKKFAFLSSSREDVELANEALPENRLFIKSNHLFATSQEKAVVNAACSKTFCATNVLKAAAAAEKLKTYLLVGGAIGHIGFHDLHYNRLYLSSQFYIHFLILRRNVGMSLY